MVQLLMKAHQDLRRAAGQGFAIDGVRMTDIVEGTVGALHILAREPNNRAVIRSLIVIPLFIQVRFVEPWTALHLLILFISALVYTMLMI